MSRDEAVALRRQPGNRDLSERQVLGEAPCGELLGRAREEREERATRRVRPPRAPDEVRRDLGAAERFLHVSGVLARRVHEDGHRVEGHTGLGPLLDGPRDLDALARDPRRSREGHALVEPGRVGRIHAEEVPLQRAERSPAARCELFGGRAQRCFEEGEGPRIAGRDGGETSGRALRERAHESRFERGGHAEIEQEDRSRGARRFESGPSARIDRRAVGEPERLHLGEPARVERGQVARHGTESGQVLGLEPGHPELADRPRKGDRKAGPMPTRRAGRAPGGSEEMRRRAATAVALMAVAASTARASCLRELRGEPVEARTIPSEGPAGVRDRRGDELVGTRGGSQPPRRARDRAVAR